MKISVIGPAKSGKKTLLYLISTGVYKEELPLSSNTMNSITLSPTKYGIIQYKSLLTITSHSMPQDNNQDQDSYTNWIKEIVLNSHIVIIMYDIANTMNYNDICSKYIPITKQYQSHLYGKFIVGNKIDLIHGSSIKIQKDIIQGIKCINISCKDYYNITQLINCIINTAVYPRKYIENDNEDLLIKALTRIYRIIAKKDKKKIISKDLFSYYHNEIFSRNINNKQYEAINDILGNQIKRKGKERNKVESKEKLEAITTETEEEREYISLDNFITLNQIAIQYDQLYIPWGFLRFFNHNDDLSINFFNQSNKNSLVYKNIIESLEEYFDIYSENNTIDSKDIEDIFSCVNYNDVRIQNVKLNEYWFNDINNTNSKGNIKLNKQAWILKWNNMLQDNYDQAYSLFLYIGNDEIQIKEKPKLYSLTNTILFIGLGFITIGTLYLMRKKKYI